MFIQSKEHRFILNYILSNYQIGNANFVYPISKIRDLILNYLSPIDF